MPEAPGIAANDALLALARPSELLDVGGGRRVSCANIRYSLAMGPRVDGAGRVAEDVRQLRARYGNRRTCNPAN